MDLPLTPEVLSGIWTITPELSSASFLSPLCWVLHGQCHADELFLREEITQAGNSHSTVTVRAKIDGNDYPVAGSCFVECTAYTRVDRSSLSRVGKGNGSVTLHENITVSPAGNLLTISVSLLSVDREIGTGVIDFVSS